MSAPNPTTTRRRISLFLIFNCAFLVFMVATAFLIRSGQRGFAPHSGIDRQYVQGVIETGSTEHAWEALKTTEVARATGFQSVVTMMDFMQITSVAMAVFFCFNGIILFRLRSAFASAPLHVPVLFRS